MAVLCGAFWVQMQTMAQTAREDRVMFREAVQQLRGDLRGLRLPAGRQADLGDGDVRAGGEGPAPEVGAAPAGPVAFVHFTVQKISRVAYNGAKGRGGA
jgi:hypothetical protein